MRRLPFLLFAALALVVGLWIGLARIGWRIPPLQPAAHGPLMIGGFLGTLICLERAVAFRRRWAFAAPVCTSLSAAGLVFGLPAIIGKGLIALGSVILLAAFIVTYFKHYRWKIEWSGLTMILGVAHWAIGNGLWLGGQPLPRVTPWWVGFLVLTIAGERLELSRATLLTRASRISFVAVVALFVSGMAVSLRWPGAGLQIGGAGLIGLGLWLMTFDVARRTIRRSGLMRFIAACLLPGYVWLIVGGALWLWGAAYFAGGVAYDAMLHAVLLGFVFSMIFGHAPIIIPAVASIDIRYRPAFYAHLLLLHASLILRVWADLSAQPSARAWAGLLNVLAITLFVFNTARSARRQPAGT